jgi:hypothetical protein
MLIFQTKIFAQNVHNLQVTCPARLFIFNHWQHPIKLIYLPDAQVYSTLHFFHSKARQATKGHEYYDQSIIKSKLSMQHGQQH